MLYSSHAIVLHTIKYGDNKLVVDMLTEVLGRLTFIVRIPKTQRGKLKKQFFQQLTLLSIEFDYRQNASMQHLRDVQLATAFSSITNSPTKLSIALFLSEFLTYATRNEQPNSNMFSFISNSIMFLDNVQEHYANFHIVFMLRLTRFVGFYPNTDENDTDSFFDLREATFTSMLPTHPDFLAPTDSKIIKTLMRINYQTMQLLPLSRSERNRIAEIIITYYRLHMPSFPNIRSFEILQTL